MKPHPSRHLDRLTFLRKCDELPMLSKLMMHSTRWLPSPASVLTWAVAACLATSLPTANAQYGAPSAYSVAPPSTAPQTTYAPQSTPPSLSGSTYNNTPSNYGAPTTYGAPANSGTTYGTPSAATPTFDAPITATPNNGLDTTTYGNVAPYPPMSSGPAVREADLVIQGYPARTGRIMFGGAVNSDAGVTGQVTIDERNFDITRWPRSFQDLFSGTAFRGAGQTLRIEAVPGSEFQRYTAQFADPNLFGYLPISMSLSGFLYDRQFDDWDEERMGGRISFGYRITPDLSISAGLNGQNVKITDPSSATVAKLNEVVANGDNALYSGMFSLIHDTRNSPLQPSEGHYIKASYEQAFGDFEYGRYEGEYRKYWLTRQRADGSGKQTLSFGTKLGISGDDTPIFENFFAGGYATIRGYDFRGASPKESGVEVGGRFQWLNSLEYMFPLTADDAFRGVAFVDFGTVEEDIEINSENFRVAPGFGFRVAIPMLGPAPLAFDFAFPVHSAPFDEEQMFSFYMSAAR